MNFQPRVLIELQHTDKGEPIWYVRHGKGTLDGTSVLDHAKVFSTRQFAGQVADYLRNNHGCSAAQVVVVQPPAVRAAVAQGVSA